MTQNGIRAVNVILKRNTWEAFKMIRKQSMKKLNTHAVNVILKQYREEI